MRRIETWNMRVISLLALLAASAPGLATKPTPKVETVGVREIPLIKDAYASSSINVVAGNRQTLYTDGEYQYAGFYDAGGRLLLAKRRLTDDRWHIQPTTFTTAPEDAHKTISLVVDGRGYLHLAWGHHNTPLNYSRSLKPGGLSMGEPSAMVGEAERSVTYPQFFRQANGDLLFLYRDGGSGNGRLVLNHCDTERGKWSRRQDNLIDGEQQRSAYWDMSIDDNGSLHLAWNWRETPDVASNHDLLYARSDDGGRTWKKANGSRYTLPITQDNAGVAAVIPEQRNLMNPPFVNTDHHGRPFIVSYWSPTKDARPRFNIVYRGSAGWQTVAGPEAGQDFVLQGHGTKRPPISRAVLLVKSGNTPSATPDENSTQLHLIYRDDSKGGRAVLASLDDLQAREWHFHFLAEQNVGGWEPSLDPEQWRAYKQAHLLLQSVQQLDGDDRVGSDSKPSPLSLLIWNPAGE
jgi:hypothetical protein